MCIVIKPLTPEMAQDFVGYFESQDFGHAPHWATCYCRYYHTVCTLEEWMGRSGALNRAEAIEAIQKGEMGGYLAYEDGRCIGWCNAGDMDRYPRLREARETLPADQKVGCVICFVIRADCRGRGVARQLLRQAVEDFRAKGYASVMALPFERPDNRQMQYRGTLNMYLEHGFEEVRQEGPVHVMLLRL
jgi:GNAT superfamily N-acetyltransferase